MLALRQRLELLLPLLERALKHELFVSSGLLRLRLNAALRIEFELQHLIPPHSILHLPLQLSLTSLERLDLPALSLEVT